MIKSPPMSMTLIVDIIAVNIIAWLICDIVEMKKP